MRDALGGGMLDDLRFAVRTLRHSPGFALAALAILAIGIGASTIVFGIIDGVVLRPLPFGERSDRLITLHSTHPTQAQDWDDSEISYPDLVDLRESSTSLEGVEGLIWRNVSLSATAGAERVAAASITPGLFRLLGVRPLLGRDFEDGDGVAMGLETSVIISHNLWQREFGGHPDLIGKAVHVNGRQLSVIGVMPPGFAFPVVQQLWLPYRVPRTDGRDQRTMTTIGLLRPDVTIDRATAELRTQAAALAGRYPDTNRGWGIHTMALHEYYVGASQRRALGTMMAAVLLVLLVASANVGSLMVARGVGRQRELLVRTALGARRGRLIRLLLIESVLVALAGGALGALLAAWGLDAWVATIPEPLPYWATVAVNGRVLAFTLLGALFTAAACGLLPALRASRIDLASGMQHNGRVSGAAPSQLRLQAALVAGQVASSFALLIAATLLARNTTSLMSLDVGFDAAPLLSMRLYMPATGSDELPARSRALATLVERVGQVPGVTAASATCAIPADDGGDPIRLVPPDGSRTTDREVGAQRVVLADALLDTLGLTLLEGRAFTAAEIENPAADVVIVNARLASTFWPGGSAIGREIRLIDAGAERPRRVIGVAPDLLYEEPGEETPQSQLTVYMPFAVAAHRTMALLIRTTGDPAAPIAAIRKTIASVNPAFAAYDIMTMSDRRLFTSFGERFMGRTFSAFAMVALLLACVGVYGVTAYSAAQRTREIAVRMAIGARKSDVIRMLLARGGRIALAGCVAGLPLAIAGARLIEGELFRVSAWEPSVWGTLPACLLIAVFAASFVPAVRASFTDPAEALRQD
jgi:predicted permease